MPAPGWEVCPIGCPFDHKIGDPSPQHSHDWLLAEVARLSTWINDCQSGMYINCVYCGHRYGPKGSGATLLEAGATMAEALKAHIASCPKHPMAAVVAELRLLREMGEELRRELAEARALLPAEPS